MWSEGHGILTVGFANATDSKGSADAMTTKIVKCGFFELAFGAKDECFCNSDDEEDSESGEVESGRESEVVGEGEDEVLEWEVEDVWICPIKADPGKLMNLTFQASDAKKPLLAVRRVVENGNHVHFGPNPEDCYINKPQSGKKLPLMSDGRGSWVMKVGLEGKETEITVDSGAQESVAPKEWGSGFALVPPTEGYKPFVTAQGTAMGHYGQRPLSPGVPFLKGRPSVRKSSVGSW